jgi:hypothetical protein
MRFEQLTPSSFGKPLTFQPDASVSDYVRAVHMSFEGFGSACGWSARNCGLANHQITGQESHLRL